MNGGRELQRLRTLHLFAGAGGGILGDMLLGHHPVCAVEIDEYCQQVLSARQKDGCIPWFPIFADVKEFDGRPWRGLVDCVCGGFPCQDISAAGKGAGITGERSGLWSEMARVVCEVGPQYVFVENSAMLTLRGLNVVLGDLAAMGYNAEWCVLGADDAGAPHIRKRIWILAHAQQTGLEGLRSDAGREEVAQPRHGGALADSLQHGRIARGHGNAEEIEERRESDRGGIDAHVADSSRILEGRSEQRPERKRIGQSGESIDAADPDSEQAGRFAESRCQRGWWESEPAVCGVVDGLASELDEFGLAAGEYLGRVAQKIPARVDRLKAIGNGQVPAVAALAWNTLYNRITAGE